jgi:heat shock protein HslJ
VTVLGREWRRWATLFWIALCIAGCAGSDENDLAGRKFMLQSTIGDTPVAGAPISLEFQQRQIRVRGGCNQIDVDYSVCDGRLCSTGYSITALGRDAERHAQDDSLVSFFRSKPSFRLDGDELTVKGLGVTLLFLDREVADPDRPLMGTLWEIRIFLEGGAGGGSTVDAHPTVTFNQDGTWETRNTCGEGGGGVHRHRDHPHPFRKRPMPMTLARALTPSRSAEY